MSRVRGNRRGLARCLSPAQSRLDHLRADYQRMESMFVDPPPPFDAIIETVKSLEDRINAMAEHAGRKRRVDRHILARR